MPAKIIPSPSGRDFSTEPAITDDGVPRLPLTPRARRPVHSWPGPQIVLDWTTEHATADDGVPVVVHGRSRRPQRRWGNQVTALDYATVLPIVDDGEPVTYPRRSWKTVRSRPPAQVALDWSTEHATVDDGVPSISAGVVRGPRRLRRPLPGIFDFEQVVAAAGDDGQVAPTRPIRRWASGYRRPMQAVPPPTSCEVTAVFAGDAAGGYMVSTDATYAGARDGSGTSSILVDAGSLFLIPGQDSPGNYDVYQAALSFDLSSIPDDSIVLNVALSLSGFSDGSATDFVIQARQHDWGATLTQADYVVGASLSTKPLRATFDSANFNASGNNVFASDASFAGAVQAALGSDVYRLLLCSDHTVNNVAPTGAEYVVVNGPLTARLVVTYCPVSIADTDDGIPTALHMRARRPLRRWPPRQPQALELGTIHAATDDEAPLLPRGIQRKWPLRLKLAQGIAFDLIEPPPGNFDDGLPVVVHGRSRRPVRSWRPRQPQALELATIHATTDDGVPVAIHSRSWRPRRRWSNQVTALDWETLLAIIDDGTPVAVHGRSRKVPRRWSNQMAALDWSTLHPATDDGVPRLARLHQRPWRIYRKVGQFFIAFDLEQQIVVVIGRVPPQGFSMGPLFPPAGSSLMNALPPQGFGRSGLRPPPGA